MPTGFAHHEARYRSRGIASIRGSIFLFRINPESAVKNELGGFFNTDFTDYYGLYGRN
jgi:hypothetical protein